MAGYFAEQPDKTKESTSQIARKRAEDAMKEKVLSAHTEGLLGYLLNARYIEEEH